jgi:hypothetical protein
MRKLLTVAVLVCMLIAAPLSRVGAAEGRDRPKPSRPTNDPAVVRNWNATAVSTVVAAGKPPADQLLYLSYVHAAVYDAVAATTGRGDQYRLHLEADDESSPAAAAAAAAHRVLVNYFPAQATTLDASYQTSLTAIADNKAKTRGVAVGEQAAAGIIALRTGDGRDGPITPPPPKGPGNWEPTPPNTVGISSWFGNVTPFFLRSGDQFRPGGPPALTSSAWAQAYDETRLYGAVNSTVRTPAQTEVARFWSDPPEVQNQRALRNHAVRHNLDIFRTARLFALVDMTATDALIGCWDAKYHYEFWRPFTAIPAAGTDGNPATVPDPTWKPLLATPNHPEYPSAHSCGTTALADTLAAFFHTSTINFDMDSTVTGTTHHFSTVAQMVTEMANARVWGGIHWRFSTVDGTALGRNVARWAVEHFPDNE